MTSVHRPALEGASIFVCAQAGCPECLGRLLRQHRGKAERELVNHQDHRLLHKSAAHCQHLLLSAGKLRALARKALLEIGKKRKDAVNAESPAAHLWRQQKILLDVEAGEYSAFLGTEREAKASNPVAGS